MGKRWTINNNNSVIIDYIFSINEGDGTAGIVWSSNLSDDTYFYVGISVKDSIVFLRQITSNGQISTLISKSFDTNQMLYRLRVVIETLGPFKISFYIYMNDQYILSYSTFSNILTAYVGIKNTASSITAK